MLLTELLPELTADYASFSRGDRRGAGGLGVGQKHLLLLPHWPAWTVMISLMLLFQ